MGVTEMSRALMVTADVDAGSSLEGAHAGGDLRPYGEGGAAQGDGRDEDERHEQSQPRGVHHHR